MIPFYRPDFDFAECLAALGWNGATRSDFEAAVATRLGVRYGLAFAYGRSAIVALLRVLNLAEADVVLPAYTCTVMAQAIVVSGNRPVFADIDLTDYNMNQAALKNSLTSRTRAVIATHLFGYPTDVDAIREIVGDPGVMIIEDSAAGFSTFSPGASTVRGDVGLVSFGPGKHLSTMGGGVLVTNSAALYEKLKTYRDKNMDQLPASVWARRWMRLVISYALMLSGPLYAPLLKLKNRLIEELVEEYPDPTLSTIAKDYATRYADFQARIGMVQLHKLDSIIAKRRLLAQFYDSRLQNISGITPAPIVEGATYLLYCMRVKRRDEIDFRQQMLNKGVGIDKSYNYVLPSLKPYQPYATGKYPCAEQAAREVVNLPVHPKLSLEQADYVAESVRRCQKQLK